ncbi:DUF2785 domain-containing protein [Eupransor demetentiae]|uniref:DUF2785 domain-containing protein n=1 Tax=Eupransor demetentiae TaxID=3109584 RepID=A0ABP0EU29_9LACO|nr:hypothetical protein R54876_GBNLAHCA_01364 [Lactobacillaceae bacterium LMG 33000]
MQYLAEIKSKLAELRDKSQKGLIFESLGELMTAIKDDVSYEKASPVILPDGGAEALEVIESYQEQWSHDKEGLHRHVIADEDLPLLLNQLASPQPKYRDTGAFFFLGGAVQNGHLTTDQMSWLTSEMVRDDQLFAHLLESQNQAAYQRSYSLALLALLLNENRIAEKPFVSKKLLDHIVDQVALIALMEADTRGFVDQKGWVHIFTHLSNVLNELFHINTLSRADKIFLMAALMANFRSLSTPLTMGEVTRIITTFMDLIKRHDIYAEYFLTNLKLWRKDIVNEPFVQTRQRWQQMYNRMQFFHEIIVCGEKEVPAAIMSYVLTTKNYLS